MTGWIYDKRELRTTPSFKDAIDFETETKFRREGARLIIDVGADLNLRYDTVATGCVYFHRFFMHHSFKEFNRYVTAIGALFLAGKVEETPKKCKDLLRVTRARLTETQYAAFGDDPKEEVMVIERVLLQTVKFDLQIEHPYQFLIKYAKVLIGSKTGIENLVQMAWTFINDSLCTTICLQWEPEIVAIALMYLASRLGKCPITDWKGRKNVEGEKWWDQFVEDLCLEILEEICHQVLDLYSPQVGGGPGQVPPHMALTSSQNSGSAGTTPNSSAGSSSRDQHQQKTTPTGAPPSGGGSFSRTPSSTGLVVNGAIGSPAVPLGTLPSGQNIQAPSTILSPSTAAPPVAISLAAAPPIPIVRQDSTKLAINHVTSTGQVVAPPPNYAYLVGRPLSGPPPPTGVAPEPGRVAVQAVGHVAQIAGHVTQQVVGHVAQVSSHVTQQASANQGIVYAFPVAAAPPPTLAPPPPTGATVAPPPTARPAPFAYYQQPPPPSHMYTVPPPPPRHQSQHHVITTTVPPPTRHNQQQHHNQSQQRVLTAVAPPPSSYAAANHSSAGGGQSTNQQQRNHSHPSYVRAHPYGRYYD